MGPVDDTGKQGPNPYHEGRHLIVAARALTYADESRIHESSNVCLVAGYRASPGQWKVFEKDWRAVLSKPEYRIKCFHSKVFFNRKVIPAGSGNPYSRWSEIKAKRFLGELLMVIARRQLAPVGCAIDIKDWKALSFGERSILAGYTSNRFGRRHHLANPQPYHLAFRVTLEDAAHGTDPNTQLQFTFAEQGQYEQRAYECWDLTKSHCPLPYVDQLTYLGFASPLKYVQLQAADLYARSWYNYFAREGQGLNDENWMALKMLNRRRPTILYCDADGMERIFRSGSITDESCQQVRESDEVHELVTKTLAEAKAKYGWTDKDLKNAAR